MAVKYSELRVVRSCKIKDGFDGSTRDAGVAFGNGRAWYVCDCGTFTANSYMYQSEDEMLYYLYHHRKMHFPTITSMSTQWN
jgi:hypothetical protein